MLENLIIMLGIAGNDTALDSRLNLILQTATAMLYNLLGGIEPPESMAHIIMEVSIIRFNRIGSEGLSSHSVEGESLSFADSDFSGFADGIQAFLESQESGTRGKLRFL